MVYVTMTDKFMSGWGMAEGKINKLVIECENNAQAAKIAHCANNFPEMKYVNVRYTRPSYNSCKYLTSWKKYRDMTGWFEGKENENYM